MWRQGVSITFIIMLRLVLFQKMTNFVIKANIIILNKAWMETCEKGRSFGTGFHQTLSICFFSFWSFGFMWKESSDVNTTRTRVHRKSFVIFRNEIIFPKRLRTFYFYFFTQQSFLVILFHYFCVGGHLQVHREYQEPQKVQQVQIHPEKQRIVRHVLQQTWGQRWTY